MKKKNFKSLVCVGILVCMVGCSAGDNGANESNTELTGQVEENIQDTTESDLQIDVESELDAAQTNDVQESVTEPDAETPNEAMRGDTVSENQTTEGTEAESIPEEPEVEMVDFDTWAKQEGNEEPCLVVWNETTKTQRIIQPMEEYVIQEGDRFAVPYMEDGKIEINGELVYWEVGDYTELHIPDDEKVKVCIVDYSVSYMTPYFLINE